MLQQKAHYDESGRLLCIAGVPSEIEGTDRSEVCVSGTPSGASEAGDSSHHLFQKAKDLCMDDEFSQFVFHMTGTWLKSETFICQYCAIKNLSDIYYSPIAQKLFCHTLAAFDVWKRGGDL